MSDGDLGRDVPGRYLKAPERPDASAEDVSNRVAGMLAEIRENGITAVRGYAQTLDGYAPDDFVVSVAEREAAVAGLDPELRRQMDFALEQVRAFAGHQLGCLTPLDVELQPGIHLGHRLHPIASVGAYVPGGRYPLLASAFMTVAVAKVAGVPRVVAAAPPQGAGGIAPVQLAAMHLAGADEIYAIGGVQALGAIAYGVDGFGRPVDMLVGAGNSYVTEAKRQMFGTVGIDALAGPSELTIIADGAADPHLVATDLLGQAEHGPTSEVILVTDSEAFGQAVLDAIPAQLAALDTRAIAEVSWRDCGAIVVCDTPEDVVAAVDHIAPEHLEVQSVDPDWYFERLDAYGTVFLGAAATVAYSDKAIGTNHVLPTGRAARYTGGLWVGSFIRVLTHQRVAVEASGAVAVAEAAIAIAGAEGLTGHALSARVRLDALREPSTQGAKS
jgi:sulfopropanediol 3-dehydrogenase